jgi:hypothetical protein
MTGCVEPGYASDVINSKKLVEVRDALLRDLD